MIVVVVEVGASALIACYELFLSPITSVLHSLHHRLLPFSLALKKMSFYLSRETIITERTFLF